MTNLPPEHRQPTPDDEPNPEMTGSFPAADDDDYLRPPSIASPSSGGEPPPSYEQVYGEHQRPPEPDHQQPPQPPQNPQQPHYSTQNLPPTHNRPPDPTATGQFPAFTDQTGTQRPEPDVAQPAPTFDQFAQPQYEDDYSADPGATREPLYAEAEPQTYETRQVQEFDVGPLPEPVESFEHTMQSSVAFPAEPEVWNEPERPPSVASGVQMSGAHQAVSVAEAEPRGDLESFPEEAGVDVDADLPRRVRRRLAKKSQPDTKLQRLRTERDSDSGWTYLAILGILFALLLGFSWGCDRLSDADQSAARNAQLASDVKVTVLISGDQISVTGTLSDEDRANQLIALVAEHYDSAQISNNLQVDSAMSADDGVIQLAGQALTGDTRPSALEATLKQKFDIPVTGNTVDFGALPESLLAVAVKIDGAAVVLSGTVPDQAKLDLLKGAAEATWGADKVDSTTLVLGDTVWDGGRITVSGNILGSVRPEQFAAQVRIEGVFVDISGGSEALDNATPDEIRTAVAQQLEAKPIIYAKGKSELSDDNKKTVDSIATLLLKLPAGESVTVVGYGDGGAGSAALGKGRANLVFVAMFTPNPSLEPVETEGADGTSTSQIIIRFG